MRGRTAALTTKTRVYRPNLSNVLPLVCIDVDGTLVGSSGEVTDAVWNAVDSARARGQNLALSTARGAFGASWDMAQRLDPDGWHVFHAGGAVVHTATEESLGDGLTPDAVDAIITHAHEHHWILELYSPNAYAVESTAKASVDHADLMGVPFVAGDFVAFRSEHQRLVRAQFVVDIDQIETVTSVVDPLGLVATSATSPIMPGIAFISITPPGITKATGIARICEANGIEIGDVMMVGDGLNDLPAIEAVGHPVAMGNAEDAVKAAARYQVGDVESNGLVEALELSRTLS